MKICCSIYHSNIFEIYKKEWIIECLKSIYLQTFQDFDIVECSYDLKNNSIIKLLQKQNLFIDKKHFFISKFFNNNIDCENFLFNYIFNELNYDICININLDDIYDINRFKYQIEKINEGYDLVSSNYIIFQNYKNKKYERKMIISKYFKNDYDSRLYFSKLYIEKKINFPFSCTTFNKKCWNNSNKKIEFPENLYLSKSILNNLIKIYIDDRFLLNHRIHDKQFSNIFKDKFI